MDATSSLDEQESVHPAHLPSQLSLVFNNLQLWYILFTCCNHNWDTLTWSLLKHLSCCNSIFSRGPQTSQKSRSHFQIPGARGLTCCKFHTKHPQFWSDPWLNVLWHFLLGACVVINIFVYKKKRTVIMLKILVAIKHNLSLPRDWVPRICAPLIFQRWFPTTPYNQKKGPQCECCENIQQTRQCAVSYTALSNHLVSFWSYWTL